MTTSVIEPVWNPAKKSLTTSIVRSDGWTVEGEMFISAQSVTLIATHGPVEGNRTTLIVRNLTSTADARKEFLAIAEAFLNGGN